jgi:hypothetical protein
MTETQLKAPFHLWIVGILAVLWNLGGAFDYTATQTRMESYMSQFTPEQIEYFYAFPAWMDAAWAIAVWGSLLASLLLLMRRRMAVNLFGLAILGLAVSTVYNFFLNNGAAVMGDGAVMFTGVIWIIALFLFFYSKGMESRRVLR